MGTFCNVSVTLKQLYVLKMLIQYVQFPLAGKVNQLKRVKEYFLIKFLILFFLL